MNNAQRIFVHVAIVKNLIFFAEAMLVKLVFLRFFVHGMAIRLIEEVVVGDTVVVLNIKLILIYPRDQRRTYPIHLDQGVREAIQKPHIC